MIISSAIALGVLCVFPEEAVGVSQALRIVIQIFLKPRTCARILPHLRQKMNEPFPRVELPRYDPLIQLSGDGSQPVGVCIRKHRRQPITWEDAADRTLRYGS